MREYRLSELYDNVSTNSLSRALLYENGDVLNLHYGDIHLKYSGLLDINKAELPFALKTDYTFKESSRMETGDVIFADAAEDYEGIGKAVEIGQTGATPSYAGLHTIHLKRKTDVLASGYMGYLSQAYAFRRKVWFIAQGAKVLGISSKELLQQSILIPNIAEQNTIVSRLKAVDQKINLLTKKKEALETYKKGLMQKIFSQELRFKREDGTDYPEWKLVKFESILIPRSQRNKNCKYSEVYSVSNKEGFIPQTKQFDGYSVASNDVSNYKLVHPNDIVYNPSRINVGSIAINQTDGIKIVSPLYNIFSVDRGYNPSFWFMLKELHYFKHLVDISCSGSVRDSLSLDDLLSFKMNLPSTEEAKRIEAFLSVCDRKISTVTKQLSALNNLKKGLLQQMFV